MGIFNIGPKGGRLRMRHRSLVYTAIAAFGAWWFYFKLDWDLVHIPFVGDFNIGLWYILVFIFVVAATAFSVNETDGLDGLSGGILLIAFASYGVIAFSQGKMDCVPFSMARSPSTMVFHVPVRTRSANTWLNRKLRMADR